MKKKTKPLVLKGDERIKRLGSSSSSSGGDGGSAPHSLTGKRDLTGEEELRNLVKGRRREEDPISRLVGHLIITRLKLKKKEEVAVERRRKWRNHMERAKLSTKVYYM